MQFKSVVFVHTPKYWHHKIFAECFEAKTMGLYVISAEARFKHNHVSCLIAHALKMTKLAQVFNKIFKYWQKFGETFGKKQKVRRGCERQRLTKNMYRFQTNGKKM